MATSVSVKIPQSLRPVTLRQYKRMWADFHNLKVAPGFLSTQVTTHSFLSFMEYLCQNNQSMSNIFNYMAAIRGFYIMRGLPSTRFRDKHISLFLKSLQIMAPLTPRMHSLIDIDILLSCGAVFSCSFL